MKKLFALLLSIILVCSMVACSADTTSAEQDPQTSDTGDTGEQPGSDETTDAGDDGIVIALMMKSLTSEWNQNIEESLEQLGQERGFTVLTFDCGGDPTVMLDQMNDAVNQGVDGFFMHIAEEGIASAAVEVANAANIPIIGESLPLKDGDGNWLAPCVVLDAAGCGDVAAQWVYDSWQSTDVDLSDQSTVGVVLVTNSLTENAVLRHEGAQNKLKELFPEIPEENYYLADISASSSDYTEGGYTETSAVLAAHPEMTAWIVIGVQDDYALGACRAIEEAGNAEKTLLISMGGEQAIPEWEAGTTIPWYACTYYTAMDFTIPVVDGLLAVINGECTLEEVYEDNIEEGQTFGTQTVSGYAITFENYQEYIN